MATYLYTSVRALVLLGILSAAAAGAQAVAVDGRVFEGELRGTGGVVRFATDSQTPGISDPVRVRMKGFRGPVRLVAGVVTGNGSVVRGAVRVEAGAVSVASARLGKVSVRMAETACIFFEERTGLSWSGPAGVSFRNGDFLAAESISVSQGGVTVESELGKVEAPLERVAAVRLGAVEEKGEAVVVLENGDMLRGRLVSASPETVEVECSFGVARVSVREVEEVYFPGRMRYVSDLVSQGVAGGAAEGIRDVYADEGPEGALESAAGAFRKGLFTRAGSRVTVGLPEGAQTFWFVPVMARGAKPSGGVFTVTAEGREVWSARVDEGAKAGGVVLEVAGLEEVTLSFDSQPTGLLGAAGVWGDAFVTIGKDE